MNNRDYCTWAMNAVDAYYGKLLKIGLEYPHTNLVMPEGQIDWTLKERDMWEEKREQYR